MSIARLLIGVDRYEYIRPDLDGCVGDVNQLHDLLVWQLGTLPERITKLTSNMGRTEGLGSRPPAITSSIASSG